MPTRSALMTGRHPVRTGAMQSVPAGLPQGLFPGSAPWRRPSPSKATPPPCTANGTWATRRGRYPATAASTDDTTGSRTTNESMFMGGGLRPRRGGSAVRQVRAAAAIRPKGGTLRPGNAPPHRRGAHAAQLRVHRPPRGKAPFFLYVPLTQLHFLPPFRTANSKAAPAKWHDFTGLPWWRWTRASGRSLDAVDQQGIADDTVFIFASDNGTGVPWLPWRRSAGMWTGNLSHGDGRALRVPLDRALAWQGAGRPAEPTRIVHVVDLFPRQWHRWPAGARKTGPSTRRPVRLRAARRNRRYEWLRHGIKNEPRKRTNGATENALRLGRYSNAIWNHLETSPAQPDWR